MRIRSLRRQRLPILTSLLAVGAAVTAWGGGPDSTKPNDHNFKAHPEWNKDCVDRVEAMRGQPCDVIFIGDSITHMWSGVGFPVWNHYFGDRHALNFGVGGDTTANVLWRLENWKLTEWKPKAAVILIGTNNTENTPEEIGAGVRAVIAKTQALFPGVRIALLGILPNERATEKMKAANAFVNPLANGTDVIFVDAGAAFVREGDNWRGLSEDKLHLTEVGYRQLAAAIEPVLSTILGEAPRSPLP